MKQKANLCNCEHKIKRKDIIDIKGSLILWSRVVADVNESRNLMIIISVFSTVLDNARQISNEFYI